MPIFRPLISFDKNETIALAKKINTLDVSIVRACETCELFAPKNPVTKPNRQEAHKLEEEELPLIKEFEEECIKNAIIKKYSI